LLRSGLLGVFLLLTLPACQQLTSEQAVFMWQSPLYQDHALTGRILHTASGQFVTEAELTMAISRAHFLLLGEKHDNPDHHQLQKMLLARLYNQQQVASVSVEMLDASTDPQLQELLPRSVANLDELRSALDWDEEGWDWSFYGPILLDAVQQQVPLRSANLTAAEVGEVYGQLLEPHIEAALDAQAMEQLKAEIDRSHCNMLPASQFPAMVRVQQSRDYRMAQSLASEAPPQGQLRVLLAGNFHVRRDLGVPNYMPLVSPETDSEQVLALAFLEVAPGEEVAMNYLEAFSDVTPFDYVWFTPAVTSEDYCAAFQ